MRRHEQERDSEMNRTEDHFGNGYRHEEENRFSRGYNRPGMHADDYSRGNSSRSNYNSDIGQQGFDREWERSRFQRQDRSMPGGMRASGTQIFSNGSSDSMGRRSSREHMNDAYDGFGESDRWGRTHSQNFSNQSGETHYGKGPKGYRRSDDRIKEDVCEALYRDHSVDASNIEVEVKDGNVTLKGSVTARDAKRAAEEAVENLSGVEDVRNEIKVMKADSTLSNTSGFKNQKLA